MVIGKWMSHSGDSHREYIYCQSERGRGNTCCLFPASDDVVAYLFHTYDVVAYLFHTYAIKTRSSWSGKQGHRGVEHAAVNGAYIKIVFVLILVPSRKTEGFSDRTTLIAVIRNI